MTEEEKKAIERIEDIIYKRDETNYGDDREITLYEDDIQKISKLLNLIDKQQKEIEELKDINASLLWQRNNIDIPKLEDFNKNYINKDKIKEKINYYDERGYIEIAGALKELL